MTGGQRWQFGPFVVDAREHRLMRGELPVALTRKSFLLLATLLGRPGQLFTKAELFDTVWAGTVVTDAALSRAIRELRVALGDDAGSPRYIETAHGLGFRFVAPLSTAAQPRQTSRPQAVPQRLLIGREAEMGLLVQSLETARSGRRQIVFVTGEAGIGKTALVDAFIEGTAETDCWAAQGRCIEQYGTAEAYLPILEALEQLARQVGAEAFRNVLLLYAPAWLAHLPWLAQEADPVAWQRALTDTTSQRMLRELAQALEVLSIQRPIVLWLEDMHWSDPSSLTAISFLAGRRDPARLMVVGSFRPGDAQIEGSPLQGLVLRLAHRGQAHEIALSLLDLGAVTHYLGLRFGGAAGLPVGELGAFIHRRTDGNALFTVAMVDDLVRRRELIESDGSWALKSGVDPLGDQLPDSLRHLVHDQIEQLAASDRRLIEAASVVGTDFSSATLAAALDVDAAEVEERCLQLVRQAKFLRQQASTTWPDGTVASGFGFVHALYWQGVHERVPQARRAEWQRRVALRQEQAHGAHCAAIAVELAMRFEAARDIERSLHYLGVASGGALSRCAYPECIALLRHALDLVPALPPDIRPRRELDLQLPLGAALMASQGYASDDVEATYRRALSLCQVCGTASDLGRALRGLWNVAFLRSDLESARDTAQRLLVEARRLGDQGLVFDAHTKSGQTCLHAAELAAAQFHLEAALASPAASDEASGLRTSPRVAAYLAWALWYRGQPGQAALACDRALLLAEKALSAHSTAFALGYVAWVRLQRGEVALAQELARQQAALSVEYGLTYWRQLADFIRGAVSVRQGDLPGGIAMMRRAIDEMQASGGRVGVPYLLCILAQSELAAGRTAHAREAVASASRLMAGNGNALYAAEARRLEGEIHRVEGIGRSGRMAAEPIFMSAQLIARQQGARALELRAAISLARLWAEDGQVPRAADLLISVRAGFSDGFETTDLASADTLLEQWGRSL